MDSNRSNSCVIHLLPQVWYFLRYIESNTWKSGLSEPDITCHAMKFIKTNRYQTRTVNIKTQLF